ncbi:dTDP-glucose 4,6-dehydratase [Patescibacteria group bacterium]|nr:dTDP-glucose 4,6-dehydratase [Patescibacteria group bacterium]
MKILVTGGAGFIGSNFVRLIYYERPNWVITIVDKLTYAGNLNNIADLDKNRVKFVKADICNANAINKFIKENDIVVHFAAESHNDNSLQNPYPFIKTNLLGTYNILEGIRKYNKRLHHVSTDEVFGDLSLNDPKKFTPDTPYNPSSPYSATKAGADMLVRAWIRSFGIQATISNCSNNYGPYQHVEKFIPRQITEIIEGRKPKLYGNGLNIRDWIHTDDHSSGVLAIIEKGIVGETYLIGTNNEKSNKEVIQMILKLMGKDLNDYEHVSDRPGHDLRYAIDSSKIKNDLGWKPKYIDFEQGLNDVINWYIENKNWWEYQKHQTELKYNKII